LFEINKFTANYGIIPKAKEFFKNMDSSSSNQKIKKVNIINKISMI
jgi:hypothetical protein